eukprot:CAMPEP_0113956076 /NCGR_PEP_ID=MMETSP0011_2-20120614/1825_1 /TAXON_ID=101924 /ORGANISM="Rhodosorus marinus" /LENGTH=2669 /DNA_ID=CAMNT_0000966111 /DNA_START=238 /DNA_END=8247 /DNA_ORIENTATION=+ /assembly_acc=CAM_ASM_000156
MVDETSTRPDAAGAARTNLNLDGGHSTNDIRFLRHGSTWIVFKLESAQALTYTILSGAGGSQPEVESNVLEYPENIETVSGDGTTRLFALPKASNGSANARSAMETTARFGSGPFDVVSIGVFIYVVRRGVDGQSESNLFVEDESILVKRPKEGEVPSAGVPVISGDLLVDTYTLDGTTLILVADRSVPNSKPKTVVMRMIPPGAVFSAAGTSALHEEGSPDHPSNSRALISQLHLFTSSGESVKYFSFPIEQTGMKTVDSDSIPVWSENAVMFKGLFPGSELEALTYRPSVDTMPITDLKLKQTTSGLRIDSELFSGLERVLVVFDVYRGPERFIAVLDLEANSQDGSIVEVNGPISAVDTMSNALDIKDSDSRNATRQHAAHNFPHGIINGKRSAVADLGRSAAHRAEMNLLQAEIAGQITKRQSLASGALKRAYTDDTDIQSISKLIDTYRARLVKLNSLLSKSWLDSPAISPSVVKFDSRGRTMSAGVLGGHAAASQPLQALEFVENVKLRLVAPGGGLVTATLDKSSSPAIQRLRLVNGVKPWNEKNGWMYFVSRRTGTGEGATTIKLSREENFTSTAGSSNLTSPYCTISLENKDFQVLEVWRYVPRSPQLLARVLNGESLPFSLGTVMEAFFSERVSLGSRSLSWYLVLKEPSTVSLPQGLPLTVGDLELELADSMETGSLKLGITAPKLWDADGEEKVTSRLRGMSVTWQGYDTYNHCRREVSGVVISKENGHDVRSLLVQATDSNGCAGLLQPSTSEASRADVLHSGNGSRWLFSERAPPAPTDHHMVNLHDSLQLHVDGGEHLPQKQLTVEVRASPIPDEEETRQTILAASAANQDNAELMKLSLVNSQQRPAFVFFDSAPRRTFAHHPEELGLGSGSFTIEFWSYFDFRHDATGLNGRGFDPEKGDEKSNGLIPLIAVTSKAEGKVVMALWLEANEEAATAKPHFTMPEVGVDIVCPHNLGKREWNHLAFCFDKNEGKREIFINGVKARSGVYSRAEAQSSFNSSSSDRGPWTTSAVNSLQVGFLGTAALDGAIDELRIFNRLRTDQDIAENFNVRLGPSEDSLVACYRIGKQDGKERLLDASIFQRRVLDFSGWDEESSTLRWAPIRFQPSSAQQSTRRLQVTMKGAEDRFSGDFTFAMWLSFEELAAPSSVILIVEGKEQYLGPRFKLERRDGKIVFFFKKPGAAEEVELVGRRPAEAGKWYHIALVRRNSGKSLQLCVDGVAEDYKVVEENDVTPSSASESSDVHLVFPVEGGSGWFWVDELVWFSESLSRDMIRSYMSNRLNTEMSPDNLALLLRMDISIMEVTCFSNLALDCEVVDSQTETPRSCLSVSPRISSPFACQKVEASVCRPTLPLSTACPFRGIKEDAVSMPDLEQLSINVDFTIEMWLWWKVNHEEKEVALVLQSPEISEDGKDLRISLNPESSQVRFNFSKDNISLAADLVPETWNHLAFRYRRESKRKDIFVNGVIADSGIAAWEWESVHNGSPMRWILGGGSPNFAPFVGWIEEVRLFRVARSDTRILRDMNSRINTGKGPARELAACYRYDQIARKFVDHSGEPGRSGAEIELTTPARKRFLTAPALVSRSDSFSTGECFPVGSKKSDTLRFGFPLDALGAGQVELGKLEDLGLLDSHGSSPGISIEFWAKTEALDAVEESVLLLETHEPGDGSSLQIGFTGGLFPFVSLGGSTTRIIAAEEVQKGQWAHFAFLFDPVDFGTGNEERTWSATILVNGLGENEGGSEPRKLKYDIPPTGRAGLRLGATRADVWIDDIRVFNRTRHYGDINRDNQIRLMGFEPNLMAYFCCTAEGRLSDLSRHGSMDPVSTEALVSLNQPEPRTVRAPTSLSLKTGQFVLPLTDNVDSESREFTLEMWFRVTVFGKEFKGIQLLSLMSMTSKSGLTVNLSDERKLVVDGIGESGSIFELDEWHHLCFQRQIRETTGESPNVVLRALRNGVVVFELFPDEQKNPLPKSLQLVIGAGEAEPQHEVEIMEVRMFDIAREPSVVTRDFLTLCHPLEAGLKAYYTFDELGVLDQQKMVPNVNVVDFEQSAHKFVANGASLEIGTVSDYGIDGGGFSLEAWIFPRDTDESQFIFATGGPNVPGRKLYCSLEQGKPRIGNGSFHWISKYVQLDAGRWYHVSFQADLSKGFASAILNGIEIGMEEEGVVQGKFDKSDQLFIGPDPSWHGHTGVVEMVDEVRIFNRLRTAQEVHGDWDARILASANGLRGYYCFRGRNYQNRAENPLKTELMATGYVKPGELIVTAHGPFYRDQGDEDFEASASALSDVPKQRLLLGTLQDYGLEKGDFAIEAWVYYEGADEDGKFPRDRFLCHTQPKSIGTRRKLHCIVRDGKPYLGFYSVDREATVPLKAKGWYHLSYQSRLSNGWFGVIVNGLEVEMRNVQSGFTIDDGWLREGNEPFFIGVDNLVDNRRACLMVDDFRVYNRTRPAAEVVADMNLRVSRSSRGLVGYYYFSNSNLQNRAPDGPDMFAKAEGKTALKIVPGRFRKMKPLEIFDHSGHGNSGIVDAQELLLLRKRIQGAPPVMNFVRSRFPKHIAVLYDSKLRWGSNDGTGKVEILVDGEQQNIVNSRRLDVAGKPQISLGGMVLDGGAVVERARGDFSELRLWNAKKNREGILNQMFMRLAQRDDVSEAGNCLIVLNEF